MKLRRGFKSEANAYSREFRAELGLKPHEPLNPWFLAEHLAIPVFSLSDFKEQIPDAVDYLTKQDLNSFSAATVFLNSYERLIVNNDAHHPCRQASNLAHELSHAILSHPATPPLDERGLRYFDREIEDEANWLGPALLVSEEAAIYIIETEMEIHDAVEHYGVSERLINMRIGVTGARQRVARRKK
ncbi:MAG TPA: zinc peptidase [Cyanobacteria bacterium UBA11369]|nr:zinc peptidase [Cyanobacteria bacterium UBA11371]HBE31270.1 zinc peptidase [Cyanobacteria bacterium UBA11368]HBE53623.1 zinc peptidase [Cyanobacteria bacterium UBA11369]